MEIAHVMARSEMLVINGMYGDAYPVLKEECNGHVQKGMRSGLRVYKCKRRGQNLKVLVLVGD